MTMTNEEYAATQQKLILLAGLIREMDLPAFLQSIGRAHATAPILDPTLYQAGMRKLQLVEELARSANGFRSTVLKQIASETERIQKQTPEQRESVEMWMKSIGLEGVEP